MLVLVSTATAFTFAAALCASVTAPAALELRIYQGVMFENSEMKMKGDLTSPAPRSAAAGGTAWLHLLAPPPS